MRLSVVIPTRNRADLISGCIESLLAQSLAKDNYEIVVVDDGSSDETAQAIKKFSGQGAIKYYYQEPHGPAAARNLGIRNASGEIIFFTGDDIIADKGLLNAHYEEHLHSDEKTAVLGFITWHPRLKVTGFMRYLEQGVQFGYQKLRDGDSVAYDNFVTSNVSLKKELLLKAGFFDENFKYPCFEDTELSLRLNSQGMKLRYLMKAKAYHWHPTNLKQYSQRQYLAGESIAVFAREYPGQSVVPLPDCSRKGQVCAFLKKIAAYFLIKPLEISGNESLLYKCYGAVLDYYKMQGFCKGRKI